MRKSDKVRLMKIKELSKIKIYDAIKNYQYPLFDFCISSVSEEDFEWHSLWELDFYKLRDFQKEGLYRLCQEFNKLPLLMRCLMMYFEKTGRWEITNIVKCGYTRFHVWNRPKHINVINDSDEGYIRVVICDSEWEIVHLEDIKIL